MHELRFRCKCGGTIESNKSICSICGHIYKSEIIGTPIYLIDDIFSVTSKYEIERFHTTEIKRSQRTTFRKNI